MDEFKKYNNDLNEIYQEHLEISIYSKSRIFNILFSIEVNKDNKSDALILKDTIKQFKSNANGFLIDLSKVDNLEKLIKSFQNKQEIQEELICMKDILKLDNDSINLKKQEDNLFIIKIKKELLSYIKGCVNIIEIFNIEKTKFYHDLKDLEKSLSKDNITNDINNIRERLEKFDTNLINNNQNCASISIIITLYQTKNFLPFLMSKKEEDIKKIEELTGEIEELILKVQI